MKEKTLECICDRDTGVLVLLINLLEVMQICKSEEKLHVVITPFLVQLMHFCSLLKQD